ncbi:MAG: hypothetical protein JKY62_05810 [Desulfocapsa sp.]|nr:hypothetical protein [Desulfocapsa sp.]
MHNTVKTWLGKSREELDEIYRNSEPGEIPAGDTQGTAILAGSKFSKPVASLARILAWKGKIFDLFSSDRQSGILINKISPFGLKCIVAKVYLDKSWLDGKDTIVIDYSKTSLVAKVIRDEIREIEPGVYLGKVWWGKKRILDFALTMEHLD